MPQQPAKPTGPSSSLAQRLQDLTETLAAVHTQGGVFRVVLQPALEALDAMAGAVLLVNGDQLEVAAVHGYKAGAQTLWQDGPLEGDLPAGDALRRREAMFFEQQGDLVRAYPELEARTGAVAPVANAVLPMFLDGQPLGALVLDFHGPHHFTLDEQGFLRTLASQCAIALGRARLRDDLERRVIQRTQDLAQANTTAEVLAALGDALQRARAPEDVAALALDPLGRALGASSAMVVALKDRLIRVPTIWGEELPTMTAVRARDTPLEEAPLLAQCAHSGESGYYADYNAARGGLSGLPSLAFAVEPIRAADLGVVGFLCVWRAPRDEPWPEGERDLLRRAAGTVGLALERAATTRVLQERTEALDAFVAFAEQVGGETDVEVLVSRAADVLCATLGDVSMVYYEPQGGLWRARAWSSDITPDFVDRVRAGFSQDTPRFAHAVRKRQAYFVRLWDQAAEQLPSSRHYGEMATYPYFQGDTPVGVLSAGTTAQRMWTEREQAVIRAVGHSFGLALERVASAARIEQDSRAHEAFVAFTEAVGRETDVETLARQAVEVAHLNLPHVTTAYYELEQELWMPKAWSSDMSSEIAAQIQAGVPKNAPNFQEAAQSAAPVFVDGWNAEANHISTASLYGAAAFLPVNLDLPVHSLFAAGTREARVWTEREKAVVRAVARGLSLALERAEASRQLKEQNAELEARTRALSGFAELTRDLGTEANRFELVRRAQEVVLSLLPSGYALYYEREGERWRNRVQVGDIGNADLQAFIDAGPLVGVTPSVDVPWNTGQPFYQDDYAQGSDTPAEMVQHVNTAAALPVLRYGEVVGVLIAVLFEQRRWTPTDKVVLETVASSLGLTLERAESVHLLAQRTRELEQSNMELARSNAELEQFAYVASHDLQEPLRTVTSFSQLLASKYQNQVDDKGQLYVRLISEATARMGQLLRDLLAFSRVSSDAQALVPVDTRVVLTQVLQDLHAQLERTNARVRVGTLPVVLGDESQLRQVFQNLIGNALKFSRPGRTPEVRIETVPEGEQVRFSVSDNGIGIAPEFFDRIFTIFQRLHTRDKFEGNGIGLSITRKIIERHGGRLWLESTTGEGTTFFFTLPAGSQP